MTSIVNALVSPGTWHVEMGGEAPIEETESCFPFCLLFRVPRDETSRHLSRVSYRGTRVNALVNARQPNLISPVCASGPDCLSLPKKKKKEMMKNTYTVTGKDISVSFLSFVDVGFSSEHTLVVEICILETNQVKDYKD